MKIEPRGKYPGVKVHLDAEEVNQILAHDWREFIENHDDMSGLGESTPLEELFVIQTGVGLGYDIKRRVLKLMEEQPNLLSERTPDQIAAALEKEEVSAREKKKILAQGQDWKKVKVKVEVEP